MAADEIHALGEAHIELADIVGDWSRPSHDLASSSIGVFDGDRLVGYAELVAAERADAGVHPDAHGRGIGTWLAGWLAETNRARGQSIVGMPVPQGSAGDRLLEALGWHVRWTSWVLQLPEGRTISTRDLPDGYEIRQAEESDLREAHDVLEDAFLEWSDRERESFDDFVAEVTNRPTYEPWNVRVVTDADGRIVGCSVVFFAPEQGTGYVARLAVRADQRNLGIAQALLVESFGVARAHGATVSELSTDSRTGALGLYEKVGMETTTVWLHRACHLTRGGEERDPSRPAGRL